MRILTNLENTEDFNEIDIEINASVGDMKLQIQTIYNIPYNEINISIGGVIIGNDYQSVSQLKINDDVLIISRKKIQSQGQILPQQQQQQIGNQSLSSIFDQTMASLNTGNHSQQQQQQKPQTPISLGQQFDMAMRNIASGNINPSQQGNLYNPFNLNNNSTQNLISKLQRDNYIKQQVKELKDIYLTNPTQLSNLFKTNQHLAELIVSGNDAELEAIVKEKIANYEKKQRDQENEYRTLMNSNPNDQEAQKKIAAIIQQKNINENLKYAEEYIPETLVSIHMLFIHLEINKTAVVALVDTGAQSTIMSQAIAEKCGLFNLCDTRYSGIAQGVGTSKIIGVIHAAQIKIEGKFIMCKITVIENASVGFIFGLDNMRSYRCNLDLEKNMISFPDAGINAKFLSDGEIRNIKEKEDEEKEKDVDMEIEKATEESFKDAKKKP